MFQKLRSKVAVVAVMIFAALGAVIPAQAQVVEVNPSALAAVTPANFILLPTAQSFDISGLTDAVIAGIQTLFDFFVQFLEPAMLIIGVGAGFGLAFIFGRRVVADFIAGIRGGGS